ncbi:hypothetical protein [Streptomyces sp. NBC_00566]|nr:hypothetical protein [Streptomyces sp. NBC_00566]WUB85161.1 hypothetical protein OG812_00385 [Streptomyces sp. NBC_00566]
MLKNRRTRRLLNKCAVAVLVGVAGGAGKVIGSAVAAAALPFLAGMLG